MTEKEVRRQYLKFLEPDPPPNFKKRLIVLLAVMISLAITVVVLALIFLNQTTPNSDSLSQKLPESPSESNLEPRLQAEVILGGLENVWEISFLPDKTLLFTERMGTISSLKNGQKKVLHHLSDTYSVGEGGLLGLAVDTQFHENRYVYTCLNAKTATGLDVRVARWKLSIDNAVLSERKDIITALPSIASGRHSGCRLAAAADGSLWVGTGDAAIGTNAQDPKNLGGKILHVTRDGMPVANNLPAPFDPRIFSYGHRNTQGIVLFDRPANGVFGYTVEHGPDVDDEINLLKSGNFGWAPRTPYVESVPMTDLQRFPDAIEAIWSSGSSTIAPSGIGQLKGKQWGAWNGALAMANLKGKHLRVLIFNSQYKLTNEKVLFKDTFGRIRTAVQGPDGNLYLSTDNGSNDQIIKFTPTL